VKFLVSFLLEVKIEAITATRFLMVQRPKVTITLDEEIFESLKKEANEQERTAANLAAYIVTKFIKDKQPTQQKYSESARTT
jgi:wyosine [tRNA(Phe)-imidazoG37] synthetase (radical SAM superfamily)